MKELLRAAFSQFEKNQIATVDAEILLAHLLGVSRKQIHSQIIELSDSDREKISNEYNELINQRLMGRPVQYITGSAPFRYLDLEVGEGVLIPRPETELIVDRVIGYLNSDSEKDLAKSVVDLGAGSGAISIAIASEAALKGLKVSMVAVEKSPEAAVWLNKNIAKYDLPIRVVIDPAAPRQSHSQRHHLAHTHQPATARLCPDQTHGPSSGPAPALTTASAGRVQTSGNEGSKGSHNAPSLCSCAVTSLRPSSFGFPSDFGLRISDFPPAFRRRAPPTPFLPRPAPTGPCAPPSPASPAAAARKTPAHAGHEPGDTTRASPRNQYRRPAPAPAPG